MRTGLLFLSIAAESRTDMRGSSEEKSETARSTRMWASALWRHQVEVMLYSMPMRRGSLTSRLLYHLSSASRASCPGTTRMMPLPSCSQCGSLVCAHAMHDVSKKNIALAGALESFEKRRPSCEGELEPPSSFAGGVNRWAGPS